MVDAREAFPEQLATGGYYRTIMSGAIAAFVSVVVWQLEEDKGEMTPVIRIANESAIEIVDGLDEGDEVVLNPRSALPAEVARLEHEILPAREPAPAARAVATRRPLLEL